MAAGRWDWLEGVRPEPALEALAREAGRALADEVLAWPPAVAWLAPEQAAAFAWLTAPGAAPPSREALVLGFQLARWELGRERDALDHALRDERARGDGDDARMARFLWRWLTEWLFELAERVTGRLTRPLLVIALDHAETRIDAAREEN